MEEKVAGLLSNKLLRVTLVAILAWIAAKLAFSHVVLILAAALVAALAATLAWIAAKLAFSHVVLILVVALVATLAAVLAATLVPIPAVPVAGRLGKLFMKPVQAGGLLAAVLVPAHAKAHVVEPVVQPVVEPVVQPVVVRAAEPVRCTVALPFLIPATTPV